MIGSIEGNEIYSEKTIQLAKHVNNLIPVIFTDITKIPLTQRIFSPSLKNWSWFRHEPVQEGAEIGDYSFSVMFPEVLTKTHELVENAQRRIKRGETLLELPPTEELFADGRQISSTENEATEVQNSNHSLLFKESAKGKPLLESSPRHSTTQESLVRGATVEDMANMIEATEKVRLFSERAGRMGGKER